jgi:hypothetical protein
MMFAAEDPRDGRSGVADVRCSCGHLVIAHGSAGCLAMAKVPVPDTVGTGGRMAGPVGSPCPCTKTDTVSNW